MELHETVNTKKLRLLKLIVYREAGGIGYNEAIKNLAEEYPDFYEGIQHEIDSIKKDLEG